jgi:integral membrane protein (TIGR01906 family)
MQNLAKLIFIGSSCIIFLVLPIVLLSYLTSYYFDAFSRHNAYSNFAVTEYSQAEVNLHFTEVIGYIQPPFTTELDADFFSPIDIAHMRDVQGIFKLLYVILVGSLALQIASSVILILKNERDKVIAILKQSEQSITALLVLLMIIGAIALVTWKQSFIIFHQILFPGNTYWMLDPSTSNLIKFFPDGIFQELAILCIIFISVELVTWKLSNFIYRKTLT